MKMKDSGDRLKRALVYTVLGFFTVGVIVAGWLTYGFTGPPRPDAMPEFVKKTLIAINGTLSLNLGLYLGLRAAIATWDLEPVGYLRKVAGCTYVLDLTLAAAFWAFVDFSDDPARVTPILPTIVIAGASVFLVVLAAVFGVETKVIRAVSVARDKIPS